MKERSKFYTYSSIALIFSLIFYLIADPISARESALNGVDAWFRRVMPSVFPFFVLTEYMQKSGLATQISLVMEPFMSKVFGVSGEGSFAYLASLFSGNPLAAKIISDFYSERRISRKEAYQLFALCGNFGPVFTISTVGVAFYYSRSLGFLLFAVGHISCFITAFILSGHRDGSQPAERVPLSISPMGFPKAFAGAVKDSVVSILNIGGFIVFFQVIIDLVTGFAGDSQDSFLAAIIGSFIEITAGSEKLGILRQDNLMLSAGLASAALAWGGLSILFQSLSYITETDLEIWPFIKARIVQMVVSFALTAAAIAFMPMDLSVFSEFGPASSSAVLYTWAPFAAFSATSALALYIPKRMRTHR
ncbi:MAG: hypothetical protein FWG30_05850 [Eubacteriaceae bacterium]|nr:hypothetical protein [Eubacteriaceae bacterium]